MKKVFKLVFALLALGGFFSIGLADPQGGIGVPTGITGR